MTRSGRAIVLGILSLFAALASSGTSASAFSLDDVAVRAQKLASASYQKPSGGLPKAIKALGYDQYRDIRFRPERALWRNSKRPLEIMFFHRVWLFEEPVAMHHLEPRRAL